MTHEFRAEDTSHPFTLLMLVALPDPAPELVPFKSRIFGAISLYEKRVMP
jgi:hypothetical protein